MDADPEEAGPPDDTAVPGLAGERTDMAWNRSGLSATVAGAAIVRQLYTSVDDVSGRVLVLSCLGIGAVVWGLALWWARVTATTTLEGRRRADANSMRYVMLGTTIFALTGLVLALLPQRT